MVYVAQSWAAIVDVRLRCLLSVSLFLAISLCRAAALANVIGGSPQRRCYAKPSCVRLIVHVPAVTQKRPPPSGGPFFFLVNRI